MKNDYKLTLYRWYLNNKVCIQNSVEKERLCLQSLLNLRQIINACGKTININKQKLIYDLRKLISRYQYNNIISI